MEFKFALKHDLKTITRPELKQEGLMLGWIDLEALFEPTLIAKVLKIANYIRSNAEVFLVLGIGGSYMGSKALIRALNPYFNDNEGTKIYYLGTNLSADYYYDLMELIKDKEIIVNVISKSGSTLEVKVAYELIMSLMREKYSPVELKQRVIITTDPLHGELRKIANQEGYQTFSIPSNIGGRYSVFTPVGLLPMAVNGIDLSLIEAGVRAAQAKLEDAFQYALTRSEMQKQGKVIEAFVVYEPKMAAFTEWLKQLFGESLGKKGQGVFPVSLINTRDLHSLEQYLQQGRAFIFETVIKVVDAQHDYLVESYQQSINQINQRVQGAVAKAHQQVNIYANEIILSQLNPFNLGCLCQFFMIACAYNGYLDGVNPFDQPGVEAYKSLMQVELRDKSS